MVIVSGFSLSCCMYLGNRWVTGAGGGCEAVVTAISTC